MRGKQHQCHVGAGRADHGHGYMFDRLSFLSCSATADLLQND